MEIRPLDAHDDGAFRAWHAAYHAADVHGRPHAAPWQLEEMRVDLTKERAGERFLPFAGLDGAAEPVCCGLLMLPQKDNLDLAVVRVWTPPQHRRRGYGAAMLDHLVAVAADHDRTTLVAPTYVPYEAPPDGAGWPDPEFGYRRGWSFDLSDVIRLVHLPVDEALLDRLGEEAAPHHRDYTLRRFRGPVPDDIVEPFGQLVGSLMVEAPSGEVALEPEVLDVDRIRSDEARLEEAGRTKYTTVALDRSGTPVAYTELVVPRHDPGLVFQWGTLVHPDHRGHRLGMALKVANLRWLQQEVTDRDRLYTANAEVNAQMIGINEVLGFRPVERQVGLHRKLA